MPLSLQDKNSLKEFTLKKLTELNHLLIDPAAQQFVLQLLVDRKQTHATNFLKQIEDEQPKWKINDEFSYDTKILLLNFFTFLRGRGSYTKVFSQFNFDENKKEITEYLMTVTKQFSDTPVKAPVSLNIKHSDKDKYPTPNNSNYRDSDSSSSSEDDQSTKKKKTKKKASATGFFSEKSTDVRLSYVKSGGGLNIVSESSVVVDHVETNGDINVVAGASHISNVRTSGNITSNATNSSYISGVQSNENVFPRWKHN